MMAMMGRYVLGGVSSIIAIVISCGWSDLVWAADPFPASSCTGLTGDGLVQCQGVVAMSAQLAELQSTVTGLAGLAGSLSVPLEAISSLWTEEGLYFFLGVGLAMVFVRAMGSRW